jgi:hypothetical protein
MLVIEVSHNLRDGVDVNCVPLRTPYTNCKIPTGVWISDGTASTTGRLISVSFIKFTMLFFKLLLTLCDIGEFS